MATLRRKSKQDVSREPASSPAWADPRAWRPGLTRPKWRRQVHTNANSRDDHPTDVRAVLWNGAISPKTGCASQAYLELPQDSESIQLTAVEFSNTCGSERHSDSGCTRAHPCLLELVNLRRRGAAPARRIFRRHAPARRYCPGPPKYPKLLIVDEPTAG